MFRTDFIFELAFWISQLLFSFALSTQEFPNHAMPQMHIVDSMQLTQPTIIQQRVLEKPIVEYNNHVQDFVSVLNPPAEVTSKVILKVQHQCSRPMVIVILFDGYEDEDKTLRDSVNPLLINYPQIVYKKAWKCFYTPDIVEKNIVVRLPGRFLYRPNFRMRKASVLDDAHLKVFMTPFEEWNNVKTHKEPVQKKLRGLFEKSTLKLQIPTSFKPPNERPTLQTKQCMSWISDLQKICFERKQPQCVTEEECSIIVKYPVVLSDDPTGVIKTYSPFKNRELKRIKRSNKLRFTLSIEAYVYSYCKDSQLCSFFQHIDNNSGYGSPLLFMTAQGKIHIQLKTDDMIAYAVSTPWAVPLNKWIRLHLIQRNILTTLTLSHGEEFSEKLSFKAEFHRPVVFDETDGYMVVGGTIYCYNLNAIISYAKFCRNKALEYEEVSFPKRSSPTNNKFIKAYESQQRRIVKSVKKRWKFHTNNKRGDVCKSYFMELIRTAVANEEISIQKESQRKQFPKELQEIDLILKKIPASTKSMTAVETASQELYKIFLEKLDGVSSVKSLSQRVKLLRQSARLGYTSSHFALYSIYKNGITIKKNLVKARFHLLTGGSLGDKMCLKALAYNHLYGLYGFPEDHNLSYLYYHTLAYRTQKDLAKHSEGQANVNSVRLTDERNMKEQLSEDSDVFHWIKHQAERGVKSAQRQLAGLMYWGQQGIKRNVTEAIKYYEEAASEGDPDALNDYSIVLLKGQGAEVNVDKALALLKQATEENNPRAFNTLGWYYLTNDIDVVKAVKYFETADELGNIEASFNLGYIHDIGKYPGRAPDKAMAFTKYYQAATRGHPEASLQVAHMTATGIPDFLQRNTFDAIMWAKYLSEHSPIMGELLREALQAYRKHQWSKALFLYLSVASTGYEVAQFNTAFLCENEASDFANHIEEDCVWNNWNASATASNPQPYALTKMGDYHYYGYQGEKDMSLALAYYNEAAKLNYPQALFNIASIMERHNIKLKKRALQELGLPQEAFRSHEDAIVHLYKMCTEIESDDSTAPCHLALYRTQVVYFWSRTSLLAKLLAVVVVVLTTVILLLIHRYRLRKAEEKRAIANGKSQREMFLHEESLQETLENGNMSTKHNLSFPQASTRKSTKKKPRMVILKET